MDIGRRPLIGGAVALAVLGPAVARAAEGGMYGMIGKMKAKPGQRAALMSAIGGGTDMMPGCLAYIISEDAGDPDGVWIAEYWDTKERHDASLSLASVKEAIAKARPLIAAFETSVELRPVAGLPLSG